jgi:hypothetical protein
MHLSLLPILFLLALSFSAHAEDEAPIRMDEIECSHLSVLDEGELSFFLAWLDGYFNHMHGTAILSDHSLTVLGVMIQDGCKKAPDINVMAMPASHGLQAWMKKVNGRSKAMQFVPHGSGCGTSGSSALSITVSVTISHSRSELVLAPTESQRSARQRPSNSHLGCHKPELVSYDSSAQPIVENNSFHGRTSA